MSYSSILQTLGWTLVEIQEEVGIIAEFASKELQKAMLVSAVSFVYQLSKNTLL